MPVNKCRVCGNIFYEEPLLRYENMPKAAQYLPDAESLKHEKGVDLEVFQCSGCGLVQLNSDPVPYYREVIRAAGVSEAMKEFHVKQFDGFVQNLSIKGRKVIEIGCGRGEYLSLIEKSGVDAYGLEYSEDSVKHCLENGLKVSKGFIENSKDKLNYAPFDAFIMLNYLEHLPDPNETLRGIYQNLIDGAVGLIEVPNFDMDLRDGLFYNFVFDHLFYFTQDSLKTTLTSNGFDIIDCNEIWHNNIISCSVKKKIKLDISHVINNKVKIQKEIEEYLSLFKNNNVAIWGASHQAFTVISSLNITAKIKYVIDSSVFKQGRYTPATHIPIVAPGALNGDPVAAIIVMAAGYSDEVVRIIRREFDKHINVAILRQTGLEII